MVGGVAEEMARSAGVAAIAVIALTILVKPASGLLALAMARLWRCLPARAVSIAASPGPAVLIVYGAALAPGLRGPPWLFLGRPPDEAAP